MSAKQQLSGVTKYYIQYSKRLTTWIMMFWAIVRLVSTICIFLKPESGSSMTAFIRGMDDIAIVCVCGYTANSIGEKGINGYFYNRNSSTNDSSDNG